jgi:hypothetical protein
MTPESGFFRPVLLGTGGMLPRMAWALSHNSCDMMAGCLPSNIDTINNEFSKMEFKKHQAIKQLVIEEDTFVMIVDTSDDVVYQGVIELKGKLNQTLQACKEVVEKRTPYRITQSEIVIKPYTGDDI